MTGGAISGAVAYIKFSLWVRKHQPKVGFEPRAETDSVKSTEVLSTGISEPCNLSNIRICLNNFISE